MEIKKNIRKRFVAFSFLSLVFASIMTIAIVGSNFDGFSKINATDTSYSLTLNESNGGGGFASSYSSSVSTNTSAKTKLGNDINIKYANAKKSSGYYVDLKASDGYIYNSNEIYSITSIKVTYTGSTLTFYKSESSSSFPSTGQALTSGQTIELSAGYDFFKIANTGSAASQITKIDLTYSCTPTIKYYEKVTSNDDLTTGQYLIVYEDGEVVLNGSGTVESEVKIGQDVTIENDRINASSTIDGYSATIDMSAKTIRLASGKYIGNTNSGSNSTAVQDDPLTHSTISVNSDGEATIICNTTYLRYNANTSGLIFRYYKAASYESQQPVSLFKRNVGESPVGPTPTVKTYSVTIDYSNSGLTNVSGSASTEPSSCTTPEKTWTLSDNSTTISGKWSGNSWNNTYVKEIMMKAGAKLTSTSDVVVKTISVDWYGNYENHTVYKGETVVDGTSSTIIESPSGTAKDYLVDSADWSIRNVTPSYKASIYSIVLTCEISTGPKAVSGVSLNPTSLTLYTDTAITSGQLVATVSPSDATNKNISYSSSLPGVATVSQSGLVEAVSAGNTTITVTTEDGGFTATCEVTVLLYKHVTGVTLNKTSETVDKGTPVNLTATILPSDAANKSVTWSSDNTSVATVNDGVVSTLAVGSANITVTTADGGFTATCKVTVNPISVSGVTLDKTELDLRVGGTSSLTATVSPDTADNKSVTWSSDNAAVTVSANPSNDKIATVTGVSEGNAIITVTTADGSHKATCAVSVTQSSEPVAGDEFELVTSLSNLSSGDYVVFGCEAQSAVAGTLHSNGYLTSVEATFNDDKVTLTNDMKVFTYGETNDGYSFESSTGFLSQSSGNLGNSTSAFNWSLTISSSGTASIVSSSYTIKYNTNNPRFKPYGNSAQNTATIEIYKRSGSVSSVSLEETNVGVNVNSDIQLHHTVLPTTAINKNVTWASSNQNVATVNDGLVHGVSSGTATITVTTVDGNKQASCVVSVQAGSTIVATDVTISDASIELSIDDTKQLSATVLPTNTTNKTITWTSSNTSVATVSSTGLVTAKSDGTATITAKTSNNITKTCSVKVSTFAKTTLLYTYDDYATNNAYDLDNCPLEGSPKLLIIPVWFSDSSTFITSSKKESVRSDIQKAYLGSNTDTGWRSVKTFYEEESQGKLTLTGTVTDWYETNASYLTYGPEESGGDETVDLVTNASNWYFNKHTSDKRSNYDTNNDGHLDGVMLIYAAPDQQAFNKSDDSNYDNLWAYCYWLQNNDASTSKPTPNVFFWASYDFMYGSTNASSRTGSSYYNGDTSHCTIDAHTFIHEMGHVLGADDYYDYGQQYTPAGSFSMQDANVGGHDPYSVMAYGWASPYIPTKSMTLTIGDFQSTHDLILLANHSVNSPFDEYLLIELYTPTGLNEFDSTYHYSGNYPQGPSTPGIRLWHVDARLMRAISDTSWSTDLYTDPTVGLVNHAFANSYSGNYVTEYTGVSNAKYYNLLQLIRNNTSTTYKPTDELSSSALFKQGNTFTMSSYNKQFVGGSNMNNGSALGWSFKIISLSSTSATIELTKN